jgi:hypothetical protein
MPPPAPTAPAAKARKTGRRTRRDLLGLVAGVITATSVIVFVLAAAAGALFVSGVVPLTGLQHYVAADLQKRLGDGWTVFTSKAAIVRRDGHAALEIQNAEFRHSSGLRIKAPDAHVRYNPWSLLRGGVDISSVDIHGVNLRLQVDASGALTLDAGEGALPLAKAAVPQTPEQANLGVIEQAGGIIGTLLEKDGILPGLDRIALTGARLILVAPDGRERVGLENVAIHLDRTADGRALRLSGQSQSGPKDIIFSRKPHGDSGQRIELAVRSFQIDKVESLFMGTGGSMMAGFPLSGTINLIEETGVPKRLEGDLALGRGRIRSPDSGALSMGIDQARARFNADAALKRVEVTTLEVMRGATRFAVTGAFERSSENDWRVSATGAGQFAGEGPDAPQPVTELRALIEGTGLDVAEIKSLSVRGPNLDFGAAGRAVKTAEGPELHAQLTANASDVRGLLAGWPNLVSPIIRQLLVDRVEKGTVDTMTLRVAMPPAALRMVRAGEPTPDEAIRVDVAGRGVRFVIGEGIPKLTDVALTAVGTGRTLAVQASGASMDLAPNRRLALSEGSFAIADTWAERPIGISSFRATGGVDALAALLAVPAFREAAPGQIDPDSIKGRIDLRTQVALPLIEGITAADVAVQAAGTIAGLSAEGVVGNERFDNGSLAAQYDRGALSLRGDVRVAGAPAQVDIRQDAKGIGEAVLTMTVDQATRQRRGLGLGGTVTGPVGLRVVKPLGRKPDASPRFEIDLARAAIDGLLPSWTKPAGRPGRLSFTLVADDDEGPDLNDINLDASPVLIRGKASLGTDGQLQKASFTQFRLATGDDMKAEIRRDGNVSKITIRGAVADARAFLKPPGGAAPRRPADAPPDVDLDLAVQILTGFNSEAIGNAALKLGMRGREMRQLEFSGRIGRAPVTIQQLRESEGRIFRVRSADGGALLRYADLYTRAFGGELVVDARPGNDGMAGGIHFSDFTVQGEPALRRVLAEQFTQPGRSAGRGDAGTEVRFTRLKGNFIRTPGRFEIKDGVIWGNEIGISAQGSIDYARNRADIAGTFVPGYALNNVFAKVPLIGPLLGGGQYEGLFAINFRIAGPATAPTMTINPLSAIAPGILRRFVDPMGGVPSGDGAALRLPEQ